MEEFFLSFRILLCKMHFSASKSSDLLRFLIELREISTASWDEVRLLEFWLLN
jgi:hypothetical protein